MNINHRRCRALRIEYDERGHAYASAWCQWPRDHPDRHWCLRGGIVERWDGPSW